MIRKTIRSIAWLAVITTCGCGKNMGADQKAFGNSEVASTAADSLDERTASLVKKKGGLPIDIALGRATSEEQKTRIRDRLAYQSQSRENAAARAAGRRIEIETKLAGELPDDERAKLKRQLEALDRIVSELK